MTDYSYTLVKLTAAIKHYRHLVLRSKFQAAADVAVDIQILSNDLQIWAEEKCIETLNF
jgi:hypothetical protein